MSKKLTGIILFFLIITCFFLRLYNLSWGSPFYFHPDERNIASSIVQLNFPTQMNPHFFAYGSFPIYTIYFTGILSNLIFYKIPTIDFSQAILVSRFYSALFSLLLIPLLYKLGKKIKNTQVGFVAACLGTFSIGFVQYAHFGTFEMWITFLSILLFYFCLKMLEKGEIKFLIGAGIVTGLLIATKISSIPLLLLPLFVIFVSKRRFHLYVQYTCILVIISFLIFFIFSPFTFLNSSSFISSMKYEASVALGTLPVFYTGEFYNTAPILFQFIKIYPFLIGPILTILFIPSILYVSYKGIKEKHTQFLLLATFYLFLFLSQAFFFAKWSRYIVPTLPFVYLIIALTLYDLINHTKKIFGIKYLAGSVIILSIIFSISYFKTAFLTKDSRIQAAAFAKEHIPSNAKIISEVYDLGITPFNPYFSNIKLFNFYELDDPVLTTEKKKELKDLIAQSDYIILPSQRIFKIRLKNKDKFTQGNEFYQKLFNEELGFKKIYQTPCDIFCKITYIGDPVFSFEETVNVFDRPTVYIFEKIE